MALQSSGQITLNEIHVEAGGVSGTQCRTNDADIRGLIGLASGVQRRFSDWYGASAGPTVNGYGVAFHRNSNRAEGQTYTGSVSMSVSPGDVLIAMVYLDYNTSGLEPTVTINGQPVVKMRGGASSSAIQFCYVVANAAASSISVVVTVTNWRFNNYTALGAVCHVLGVTGLSTPNNQMAIGGGTGATQSGSLCVGFEGSSFTPIFTASSLTSRIDSQSRDANMESGYWIADGSNWTYNGTYGAIFDPA